jgi:carbonic anhydrase
VGRCCPGLAGADRLRALSFENVIAQLAHLRTHPSVAAAIAQGEMALHGWFVDINAGQVLGLDGETGTFVPLRDDQPLPVALQAQRRVWPQPAEAAA